MLNFLAAVSGNGAGGGGGSFESIATVNPSSASVSFTSIPNTYQHLQIRYVARDSAAVTLNDIQMRLNNITTGSYAFHWIRGSGSAVSATGASSVSYIQANDVMTGASSIANTFGVGVIDIHDYASTTKNTTIRWFSGNDQNGSGYVELSSGLLNNTAAINRIDFLQTFASGSTFALYGIKGA